MIRQPPSSTLLPDTTLFGSDVYNAGAPAAAPPAPAEPKRRVSKRVKGCRRAKHPRRARTLYHRIVAQDRKSTRLNSSHANISYAVFCLKKKNNRGVIATLCT